MFSVLAVVGYCIILSIISLYMMKPYSEEAFFEAIKIKSPAGQEADSETEQNPNSLTDLFRYVGNRIETRKKHYWNDMLPEQKLGIFSRILLVIIVAFIVFIEIRMNLYSDRSTINFVLTGNWKRGMNLLGWSAALIVVIAFVIFSFLKDILQRFFCSVHDPKIETVFRLFFSLVQYIAVIFSIYLILGYLGFNTTMQLTSIGIFSLAISLGSQTLVSDILAGIFIIFEGGFHVGDIIDIDGFSGVVQEIGVRSTKLIGLGNDTMIINNSKINRILNMSQMNDWFTMEFCINYDQPLTEIEDMLNRELPELKNTIPEIISGPYYKGVWSISSGSGGPKYTLSITCECDSNNTRMVQRKLNHALIMLFDKYQYKLA
jgi:small conductance mechanosensitive channel